MTIRDQIFDAHRRVAEIQEGELQRFAHQIVGPDPSDPAEVVRRLQ